VVRRDGSRASLPLDDDGMVPQRLGVPAARLAYVDVALTRELDAHIADIDAAAAEDAAGRARRRAAAQQDRDAVRARVRQIDQVLARSRTPAAEEGR
jgi:hypothetical protein